MLTVLEVDTSSKNQVRRFVDIPFRLYARDRLWVPPLRLDVAVMLNRRKHPFYEHSEAAFLIAVRDGRDVGRIAALENRNFNRHHGVRTAQFYLFECEDDETGRALFERVYEWARARDLDTLVGPKGFGALDGYGFLVEGFEHRPMMTMMNYNPTSYPRLVTSLGFEKEVDFVSCHIETEAFRLPERIHRVAERVVSRGRLRVQRFTSKRGLRQWAARIGQAYNASFVDNWEYVPLTEHEIEFLLDNLLTIAVPRLIKVIVHGEDVVGFLFAFPDVSAALQRARGRLLPRGIFDLLLEMKRTRWVAVNGAGILPKFQGLGGNALLYSEMEKTIRGGQFHHADLTQVAETAVQMRSDLENLGGRRYKNHRVYTRQL